MGTNVNTYIKINKDWLTQNIIEQRLVDTYSIDELTQILFQIKDVIVDSTGIYTYFLTGSRKHDVVITLSMTEEELDKHTIKIDRSLLRFVQETT